MQTPKELLAQDGYIVFPGVVPDPLRTECIDLLLAHPEESFTWSAPEVTPYAAWLAGFLQSTGLDIHSPSDAAAFNRPPGDSMRWHDDQGGGCPGHRRVFVCSYLTDTRQGRGALRIIPGSHRGGHSAFRERMQRARLMLSRLPPFEDYGKAGESIYADLPDVFSAHPLERHLESPPGSVVVVDERLIHGSVPNAGPGIRVMVLTWMWKLDQDMALEAPYL